MTSLWRAGWEPIPSDVLEDGERCEDVVVGAGLTGMVTALLLARAGRDVVVLESRDLGAVATGNTTAKISLLQATKLSQLLRQHPEETVSAYLDGNREGLEWLLRYCREQGVLVQRRAACTYAPDRGAGLRHAEAEHEAARRLGLDVRWEDDLPVPFEHAGGSVLDDQAQVDPMELLDALAGDLRAHGGRLVTGARVTGVRGTGEQTVRCADGRHVRCSDVVLATGTPVLDRGLHFSRVSPERSYAVAYEHPAPPEMMLISAHGSTRSVRDAPDGDGRLLLVGGEGHTVGRTSSEEAHVDRLRAWTQEHFPEAVEVARWSAQDYSSDDGLPIVGPVAGSGGRIHVATGYAKWGMTNAVAAALGITATVLGGNVPWAETLWGRPTGLAAARGLLRLNAGVVTSAARHAAGALRPVPARTPGESTGAVGRDGLRVVARSTVDGGTCAVSALCTHLGGVVEWNDAERTWDCPLHGSRFAPTGEVLEGPATRPLRSVGE